MLKRVCCVCKVVMGYKEGGDGETHSLCSSDACLRFMVGDDDTLFMEVRNAPSSEYPSAE